MIFNFFRYDHDGKYHPFSLIHYLSLKSFYMCNPNCNIKIYTNKTLYYDWLDLLQDELNNDLIIEKIDFNPNNIKYFHPAHAVDNTKLRLAINNKGWYVDSDLICLRELSNLINNDKSLVASENDHITHQFDSLWIGLFYANSKVDFFKKWLESYNDYDPNKDWVYYSGYIPTKLRKLYKDDIKILTARLVNPLSGWTDDLTNLFLHNYPELNSYTFHVSETASWDTYLKGLTVEHIMTVDTTFTKTVRRFVSHLWDDKLKRTLVYLK